MRKLLSVLSIILTTPEFCRAAWSQSSQADQPSSTRLVIADPSAGSGTVIAIPPSTSWTGKIGFGSSKVDVSQASDLSLWLNQQRALNGLVSVVTPWHIVISYEQFDEDGDKIHSGAFDELWAGPMKYRANYKADDLNQTDYATAHGLYRLGDQQWPNRAQAQIPQEVINPFFYAATLRGVHVRKETQVFGTHALQCTVIENGSGGISNPTQYCFDTNGTSLRYSRGSGWYQTTYNDLVSFAGHSVGRTVDVYDGGKPYLKLHVERLEEVPEATDADFDPPVEAKNLSGQVLTGVSAIPLQQSFPEWPESLRREHFSVTVEILIGRDGHVQSAQSLSGPPNAFKAAEAAVRKWIFQPYMVLDQPAEVRTKVILNNN